MKARAEPIKVWDGKGPHGTPPCPKKDDKTPTDYKGGRIYQSVPKSRFRVICVKGDYNTEKGVKWEGDKPTLKIWKAALATVDGFKKGAAKSKKEKKEKCE